MDASVAVLGAGVAGLSCAAALRAQGVAVTVFEQSRQVGGRLASRRTELGTFDQGAQFFTVRNERFAATVERWHAAHVVEPWSAAPAATNGDARFVGTPSMDAIASYLASDVDVRLSQHVRRIEQVGSGSTRRWSLECSADPEKDDGIAVTEGLFGAVVVALPAARAREFLECSDSLLYASRSAAMQPCWSLMLGFAEPVATDFVAGNVESRRLSWIARDSSKPRRRAGDRWVAQASGTWSRDHFDDDPDDVRVKLTRAFRDVLGVSAQPIHSTVHRWRCALVTSALGTPCLWDPALRLGACGDWCIEGRVEAAWLSGQAMAERLVNGQQDSA
jgi:renalase